MEISALDRANTDRPTLPTTLPGAGTDMFDQLLAGLTKVADPYGEDEPAEDDTPPEKTETRKSATDTAAARPDQVLAMLAQAPASQDLVQIKTPGTAFRIDNVTNPTAPAPTAANTDVAEAATLVAQSPQIAAIAQAANAPQQRAAAQATKTQTPQQQTAGISGLEAGEVSLRAGRDEALQQGNGQFQTPAANASATDNAASKSPTNEQSAAQPNQQAERPAPAGDSGQLAQRPDSPAPEVPKSMVPVPPVAVAAAAASTTAAPTTNVPIEQAIQPAAGARTGAVQAAEAAKQPSPARQSAAARGQQPAQQVAVHIRNGLKAGADTIHIRLNPEELGRVEVRMQIEGDKSVQAVITVEKTETLEQLQRDSRILQRALEDAGFKASHDSFTFEQNQSAPNQKDEAPGGRHIAAGNSSDPANDLSDQEGATLANSRSSHDGLVDIEV